MTAYKLFRMTKTGLAPLFINPRLRLEIGKVYQAEDHPTKNYAHRPGWHCTLTPCAPHLKQGPGSGRVWCRVEVTGTKMYARPESQGGSWVLAETLKVLEILR